MHLKIIRVKLSFLPVLYSIEFPKKTPMLLHERWNKRTPNIQFFKVWGFLVKVSILEPKKRKIGPKTIDAIFIGYALDSNVN